MLTVNEDNDTHTPGAIQSINMQTLRIESIKTKFFDKHSKKIKLFETPLNRVTFIKIFSSFLSYIGVRFAFNDYFYRKENIKLFDLNLFCEFFYSVNTSLNFKELKDTLFEIIDQNPKTNTKKTDIIILDVEDLDNEFREEIEGTLSSSVDLDALSDKKTFYVFIKRLKEEREMKKIFVNLKMLHPKKVGRMEIHFLSPVFSLHQDCIGWVIDFIGNI